MPLLWANKEGPFQEVTSEKCTWFLSQEPFSWGPSIADEVTHQRQARLYVNGRLRVVVIGEEVVEKQKHGYSWSQMLSRAEPNTGGFPQRLIFPFLLQTFAKQRREELQTYAPGSFWVFLHTIAAELKDMAAQKQK